MNLGLAFQCDFEFLARGKLASLPELNLINQQHHFGQAGAPPDVAFV